LAKGVSLPTGAAYGGYYVYTGLDYPYFAFLVFS
jgi:hypothetical protein